MVKEILFEEQSYEKSMVDFLSEKFSNRVTRIHCNFREEHVY